MGTRLRKTVAKKTIAAVVRIIPAEILVCSFVVIAKPEMLKDSPIKELMSMPYRFTR
jgi:hypothetical protein